MLSQTDKLKHDLCVRGSLLGEGSNNNLKLKNVNDSDTYRT
jgi:hypothetical protein